MARTRMNSNQARKYVRIAQLAGVGVGVMAVMLWAMDIPFLDKSLPRKPEATTNADSDQGAVPNVRLVSIEKDSPAGIGDRLDLAVKRPKVETKAPPPIQEQAQTPPPNDAPAWKYLGQLKEPGRTLALLSLDGTQRFVAKGATLKTGTAAAEGRPESAYRATLTNITPEYIELEDGNKKITRVDLEARQTRVSWVKPVTVTGGSPSIPTAGLSAEARQRLVAGQIDPNQVERARQAASQALAGRNRALPSGAAGANQGVAPPPVSTPTYTSYPGGTVVSNPGSNGTDKSTDTNSDTTKKPLNTAKGTKAKAVD